MTNANPKRMHPCIAVFAVGALSAALAFAQSPPTAEIRPVTDDYFGTKVVDNYRWMANLKDPEMQQWMKAQADYTRQTLDALPGYPALLKRIAEPDASGPRGWETCRSSPAATTRCARRADRKCRSSTCATASKARIAY